MGKSLKCTRVFAALAPAVRRDLGFRLNHSPLGLAKRPGFVFVVGALDPQHPPYRPNTRIKDKPRVRTGTSTRKPQYHPTLPLHLGILPSLSPDLLEHFNSQIQEPTSPPTDYKMVSTHSINCITRPICPSFPPSLTRTKRRPASLPPGKCAGPTQKTSPTSSTPTSRNPNGSLLPDPTLRHSAPIYKPHSLPPRQRGKFTPLIYWSNIRIADDRAAGKRRTSRARRRRRGGS